MKKILITGASGFIGSFLIEEALKRKYDVYAGIRKTSSKEYLNDSRIKFVELDFSDTNLLNQKIFESPYFDFVIHNAGLTKAFRKKDYLISNYEFTKNFVNAFIQQKKIPEKFIYMSSLAAYGPGDPLSFLPVKSMDIPNPVTSYGKSKLKSELFFKTLNQFPYIIIRPTAVYGPREKDLFTMFKLINNNLELFIGKKKQQLTFIYVKDLVKAVYKVIESDIVNKEYFVSDGNTYDSLMLGRIIKEGLNKKTLQIRFPIELVKFIATLAEASKYITRKQVVLNLEKMNELKSVNWNCDVQPLVDDLNFYADYNLKQGINETIDWYRKENWLN